VKGLESVWIIYMIASITDGWDLGGTTGGLNNQSSRKSAGLEAKIATS